MAISTQQFARQKGKEMADRVKTFEIAAGTTMGADHFHARSNRQDAWSVEHNSRALVAIVCDGCGDPGSPGSEVGAALAARLLACRLSDLALADAPPDEALARARLDILEQLRALASSMGDLEEMLRRYFLFTVVGTLITEREALFFSIGDGFIAVNGKLLTLGPYPDNAPPYMAYALLPNYSRPDACQFVVHLRLPTPRLERFLLASDGVAPLFDDGLTLPGRAEVAGGLDRWWHEDIYYSNPVALTNRLRLLTTDAVRIDWQAQRKLTDYGRMHDDATLVLGRSVCSEERGYGDE